MVYFKAIIELAKIFPLLLKLYKFLKAYVNEINERQAAEQSKRLDDAINKQKQAKTEEDFKNAQKDIAANLP